MLHSVWQVVWFNFMYDYMPYMLAAENATGEWHKRSIGVIDPWKTAFLADVIISCFTSEESAQHVKALIPMLFFPCNTSNLLDMWQTIWLTVVMGTLEKVIEADGSYQIEGSGSQVPFQRLPVDIVLEILLQLPFEYLGRLKCVGNAFNSLLKDPHFLREHHASITKCKEGNECHCLVLSERHKDAAGFSSVFHKDDAQNYK